VPSLKSTALLLLRLPKERPSHKMLAVLSPKGGSWSQAFHAWTAETGDESAKACVIIWSPFANIFLLKSLSSKQQLVFTSHRHVTVSISVMS